MTPEISYTDIPIFLEQHHHCTVENRNVTLTRYGEVACTLAVIPEPTVLEMRHFWEFLNTQQLNKVDFNHEHGCIEYFPDFTIFTIQYARVHCYIEWLHPDGIAHFLQYYPSAYMSAQLMEQYPLFFANLESTYPAHHWHRPDALFPLLLAHRDTPWLTEAYRQWPQYHGSMTPEQWLIHVFSYFDSHTQRL